MKDMIRISRDDLEREIVLCSQNTKTKDQLVEWLCRDIWQMPDEDGNT